MIETLCNDMFMEEVEEGIYSSIEFSKRASDYDRKVTLYDWLIGNPVYNRVIWGNWPKNYAHFCQEALDEHDNGVVLDAGCGSLVFTAKVYANAANKEIILLDRSLGMLKKAKERLIKLTGKIPNNIVLIQGDIFDLPFKNNVFDTVISVGVLHMFDNKKDLLDELRRVKKKNAKLYMTSLVANNWLGKKYMEELSKAGEVGRVYSSESLKNELDTLGWKVDIQTKGNMVYLKGT